MKSHAKRFINRISNREFYLDHRAKSIKYFSLHSKTVIKLYEYKERENGLFLNDLFGLTGPLSPLIIFGSLSLTQFSLFNFYIIN